MTENAALEIKMSVAKLRLIGGWLCLDFANTIGPYDPETGTIRGEHLHNYADLVLWGQIAGILSESETRYLLDLGEQQPTDAEVILQRAKALRETIYNIFSAPHYSRLIRPDSLEFLNKTLAEVMPHARIIEEHEGQFVWGWATNEIALDRVLWDVARSAADLLTSGERLKVRECSSPTCNWLFVDSSKNHHRRWCSMDDCGNRAKVRKHRQKHQTANA